MHATYTGDLVDGVRHGTGVLVFANGDRYDGAFVQGFRHGHGVFTSERGSRVYDGEWRRSEKHGVGHERWLATGDRYDGEYAHDAFEGRGVLVRGISGSKYDGEFQHGQKHGRGRMTFGRTAASGSKTIDAKTVGMVAASSNNSSSSGGGNANSNVNSEGAVYEGEWKDGRMHGDGKYTRVDGSVYTGAFVRGLYDGAGKDVSVATGDVYDGQWRSGQRHGNGCVMRLGMKRLGVWENGRRVKWTSADVPLFKKDIGSGGGNSGNNSRPKRP